MITTQLLQERTKQYEAMFHGGQKARTPRRFHNYVLKQLQGGAGTPPGSPTPNPNPHIPQTPTNQIRNRQAQVFHANPHLNPHHADYQWVTPGGSTTPPTVPASVPQSKVKRFLEHYGNRREFGTYAGPPNTPSYTYQSPATPLTQPTVDAYDSTEPQNSPAKPVTMTPRRLI